MIASAQEFAQVTWGGVQLHDRRLTERAVRVGACMTRQTDASLATQMKHPAALEAAYRLLNHASVTLQSLLIPSYEQTRQLASHTEVVLWVNDATELDYTFHRATQGLGPIGDGRGRGLLMHTTLAIQPHTHQILGVGHVEVYLRQPTPQPHPKWTRSIEGRVWEVAASAIGSPPPGVLWVEVSDAGSDSFRYLAACVAQHKHFLIRVAHNRWLAPPEEGEGQKLIDLARALAPQPHSESVVEVAATKEHPARTAQVVLAWSEVRLPPSSQAPPEERLLKPVDAWVVRVWEPQPPAEVKGLEWILLSSLPVTRLEEARERVDWYSCRWLCEDFHQCLKTGCQIERSQLDRREDLEALLGFAVPIALRLLQLRQAARQSEDRLALEVLDPLLVEVVAEREQVASQSLSVKAFWRLVARLGGFQGRARDGDPGWRTLWWGWRYASDLAEGARLLLQRRTNLR